MAPLRRLITAMVLAAATLATAGFSPPAAPVRAPFVEQGPIPCWDGTSVELGQFCPLPKFQCADGSSVPLGQFCSRAPAVATPLPQPTPTPLPAPLPTPTAMPERPAFAHQLATES